ncbi:MAG: molybdopterin-dependent oxidoreductase [Acidobacteriia bacterium]|nr:molybdopterin-dependent oxidoreductase [Terriglobia bacterium]
MPSLPQREIRHSVCALDCPDACSLLVTIEDGRATKLRGNPDHPVTRGFLCAKVAQYLERQYHPDRLLYPMRRTGAKGEGRFARIRWDEALDEIAANLQAISDEYGPEAILPYSYGGNMGFLNGNGMDRRFFHRLGASRLDRTICAAAGGAGLMQTLGSRYGTEPEQFAHSKLIIAWGANIMGTNVHLWPFIAEARRNGARLYTIDPVKNRTGRLADRHYFINPGSDLALALGLMHVIVKERLHDVEFVSQQSTHFDKLRDFVEKYPPEKVAALTGIGAEEIAGLAREYATTSPAVIRLNYGVQRSERGGAAVAAIAMLPALIGSWRQVGGGLQLSTSQAFQLNRAGLEMAELQERSPLKRQARMVNMTELAKALTVEADPPVKALFVYNSNPAAVAPDQNRVRKGLGRTDLFTVVSEQFQTDTADWADIVLPATTFLENTDLYFAYGHYHIQMARPALDPPGECKTNVEMFRLLARRMGFREPCFSETEDEMMAGLLGSAHPFLNGIDLDRLDREHSVRLNVSEPGTPFLPFASGPCNLDPALLEYTPPVESRLGSEDLRGLFPLEMISPKNDDSMNSTFGNRPAQDQETAVLYLNTADAAMRGITSGDQVRVFNGRGSLTLRAEVDGVTGPGVVSTPSTRWSKRAPDRRNCNVLTSERLTDMGGGATFYSCLVQVERCGD